MEISKPKVVIAGAGGGKTYQMINEIIKILPILNKYPEKFCAVVTYTNSATEEIKNRISKISGIPKNLHISTTHSFLTKFVIEPYAHLYNLLPIEKNYIDKITLPFKAKNIFIEKAICKKTATKYSLVNGLVIYDKILEVSNDLINIENVCKQVSNRLAYIFVDEYQDMRIYQHNIFQSIISNGVTNFYCIGDPLQSIFNFTYSQSQLAKEPKPTNFNESPILELNNKDFFEKETLTINNRCSNNIINFINNFNQVIGYKQVPPIDKDCNNVPVFFITGASQSEIIEKYDKLILDLDIKIELGKFFSLFLAKDWNTFDNIDNITTINNENSSGKTMFNECSRCVLGALGMNKATFLESISFKDKREAQVQYRQFCFSILKDIRNSNVNVNSEYIVNEFKSVFKIVSLPNSNRKSIDISKSINKLKIVNRRTKNDRFCSSIHTSKGLEATSVFVIAKTNNQLIKWLSFDNVIHDTDDDYRLGYVAFSRARELLCITSLEKPSKKILEMMGENKIEII